ncbi:MAG TPA: (d)CMP kinase [Mycobacteriales bacterium]|nr:(d)CMP kinase [Mycobacteriales bacterium]
MRLTGVVAMDGPSGTGKSSVARTLARTLDACYLDTGAMYRAVTWAVLRAGVDPGDTDAVTVVADKVRLEISTDPDDQRISADGERVDHQIRSQPVTATVSAVSAVPGVRATLVAAQRAVVADALAGCGIVVEGRDIGTVVAPDARLKVFLTASAAERAARRSRQDGRTGVGQVDAVQEAMRRRDAFDSSRAASPLRIAEDAVEVDSTHLSLTEVVEHLVALARDRGMVVAAGHR